MSKKKVRPLGSKSPGAKSTSEEFVESLSKKEREKFIKEYRELLLSELILAVMEKDELSVRKVAKTANKF